MNESPYHQQREKALLALAQERFDLHLSPAERDVLHDSVRPGPQQTPENKSRKYGAPQARLVRGDLLRWIAGDKEASALLDLNGMRVEHATITGVIDLSSTTLPYDLNFDYCVFGGVVALSSAQVMSVFVRDSHLQHGLYANNLVCKGYFEVSHCRCAGPLELGGISITQSLNLVDSNIDASGENVNLDESSIGAEVRFDGVRCARPISMRTMHTGGTVAFTGANLSCTGTAISLQVSTIGGELYLNERVEQETQKKVPFECAGGINASHLKIGQDIHAANAIFTKMGGKLVFSASELPEGGAHFSGCRSNATLDFSYAIIRDGLQLDGARFDVRLPTEKPVIAVSLKNARLSAYASFNKFASSGSIQMDGGFIEGILSCKSSNVQALLLANLHISRDIQADGTVFTQKTDESFLCENIQVGGSVDLSRITCFSPIVLNRTRIGGDLDLRKANIEVSSDIQAVTLNTVSIGGDMFVSDGFDTPGVVSMQTCSVDGNISAAYSRMSRLQLERVQAGGDFSWFGLKNGRATGLSLDRSSVTTLYDDRLSWPKQDSLKVTNFKYQILILLQSPNASQTFNFLNPGQEPQTVHDRTDWLKLQNSTDVLVSQPWQQLASFYEARGDDRSAKESLYMMARVQGYSDWKPKRALDYAGDRVEQDPLHITYPIIGLWAIGSVVFWRARRMGAMAPKDAEAYKRFMAGEPIPEYIPFNAVIYALENVLPVVKFGQDEAWGPNPAIVKHKHQKGWRRWSPRCEYRWLAMLRWTLIVLGWALALILAGAIGGRFKT